MDCTILIRLGALLPQVFRPLGGLASEVAQLTPPLEHWRRFVYCQSMAGRLLGAVDHFPGQEHPTSPLSPEPLAHLPQNRLLQLLAKRVEAAGPGILCWGQKVTR